MNEQKTVIEKGKEQVATVPVSCPHCGKGFFHKIGHVLKEVGKTTAEIALSNVGAFKDE